MAVWKDGFENGNVELGTCWQVQAGGFHIYRALSARAGGRYINWLRGDNVASTGGTKRISHVLPPAADLSKSVLWAFLFKFSAGNTMRLTLFANDPSVAYATVGINAYALYLTEAGNLQLYRWNGGGATTLIINADASFAGGTDEHLIVITREISGANRNWRLYLDPPIDDLTNAGALVGGPTNDATYGPAQGLYYGINCDERDQIGEITITS